MNASGAFEIAGPLINRGGVEIENTGTEPLVLTFDFPQHAHSQTPGVAVTK